MRRCVGDLAGADDNPNFGIRLVAAFESEAGYVAVSDGANYSTIGTLWLDMIGFTGEPVTAGPELPPQVRITQGAALTLSWPRSAHDYFLESREALSGEWVRIETPAEELEGEFQLSLEPQGEARFFRLRKNSVP